MSESCDLYIARVYTADDDGTVRIDARIGSKLLGRIEVSLRDFAAAVMGQSAVPATFTTVRQKASGGEP